MTDPSRMHYPQTNMQAPDVNVSGYNAPLLGMNHGGISMGQHQQQPASIDETLHIGQNTETPQGELNVPNSDSQSLQLPVAQQNMPLQAPLQVPQEQPSKPHHQGPELVNTATLCRIGQEIVQEIIIKATDIFQVLKVFQLPSASQSSGEDLLIRINETKKSLKLLFERIRMIYDRCNEDCGTMEYTLIEQSLIPMKDCNEYNKFDEKKSTEVMKHASEEYKETAEILIQKNRHLKEIIDHMRSMIWEINTMLAMRKP